MGPLKHSVSVDFGAEENGPFLLNLELDERVKR